MFISKKVMSSILIIAILCICWCIPATADSIQKNQIIWDNEFATISFVKAERSIGIIGYYVYLDVQNKSEKTITIGIPQSAINNYSCSIGFGSGIKITGGNSATVMTLLPTQKFYDNLYNIQLRLSIIDDEWNKLAESEWIELDISDPESEPQPDTEIEVHEPIIENDFVSISYLSAEPVQGIHSHKVMFHIINNSPNEISLYIDQGALNGRMCASTASSEFATILDGNKSICPFIFNMLEDVGEIDRIQFRFHVIDNVTHEELFVSDLIEITP